MAYSVPSSLSNILGYRAKTNLGLVNDAELGTVGGGYIIGQDGTKYNVPKGTTAPARATTTAKIAAPTARTGAATTPARTSATTPSVNSLLKSLSATMGGYTDAATGEMRGKQEGAESLLRSQPARLQNDPSWGYARTAALQAAQNPGIDPALLARMRGRAAAGTIIWKIDKLQFNLW